MAKKVVTHVKLQLPGGKATPAPPVGPALGQHGVNIMAFCKQFNAETASEVGIVIPVIITVYDDRSFTFIKKTPPAGFLLLREAGLKNGSKNALKEKVGSVTKEQVKKIAQLKMPDLNARDINAAMRIIEGTARSMGLEIKG